jgi:hypothetical protein
MKILTIQGLADRVVPYGAGCDWAFLLPQARLLTIEGGSHFPWIEAPEKVFGAIRKFLDGQWNDGAEQIVKVAWPISHIGPHFPNLNIGIL